MALLCTHCSALVLSQDPARPPRSVSYPRTVGALSRSAADCALCETILDLSPLSYLLNRFPDIGVQDLDTLPIKLKVLNVGQSETAGILWFILQGNITVQQYKCAASFDFTVTIRSTGRYAHDSPLWRGQDSSFVQKCAVIKSWLQECTLSHPDCSAHPNELYEYPTRLIHVGSENENPRVVNIKSSVLHNIVYAALSHCWGDAQPLKLMKNNLLELQEGIPLEVIPRTFLEAIKLTRRLDIPYLWIDSLCIIQDDPEDWGREAARMMQVYSGSLIVISAEDSRNAMQGCFVDAKQDLFTILQTFVRTINVQPQGQDTTLDIRIYDHNVQDPWTINVLRTRGWALQEQLLAHREVICTRPELRWRCRQMQKTEIGHEFAIQNSLYRGISSRTVQGSGDPWCIWMEDYSSREFTFPSDRVSALAGIIHHYSQSTGYEHVLACWRETMIGDLLWIRGENLISSENSIPSIPSWSWLSRAADISFDLWRRTVDDNPFKSRQEDNSSVIRAKLNWAGEPMISNILSSALVLEGSLREMTLRVDLRALGYNPPCLNIGDEEPEVKRVDQGGDPIPWRCAGRFDNEIMREDNRYTCLLMRTVWTDAHEEDGASTHVSETFLMLTAVPSKEGDEVFRRVGIANVNGEESMFKNAPRTRIRLV